MIFNYRPNVKLHLGNILLSGVSFLSLILHHETHAYAIDALSFSRFSSYTVVFLAFAFSFYYSMGSILFIKEIVVNESDIIIPQFEIFFKVYKVKKTEVKDLKVISKNKLVLLTEDKNFLLKKDYFKEDDFLKFVDTIFPEKK